MLNFDLYRWCARGVKPVFRTALVMVVLGALSVAWNPVAAATFVYENTTVTPIPDNACPNGADITFTVPDTFTVQDLNVGLVIEHTWRNDLIVTLTSPQGTVVELFSRIHGSENNLNVLLDSDVGAVIPTGDHPLAPDYLHIAHPEITTALDAFDGEAAAGTWTLTVCDDVAQDTGSVLKAKLEFTGSVAGGQPVNLRSCALISDEIISLQAGDIYTMNTTTGNESFLYATGTGNDGNALAGNTQTGIIYYGENQNIHAYNPETGVDTIIYDITGQTANPAGTTATPTLTSAAGTFHNGYYYFAPEIPQFPRKVKGVYRLRASADGLSLIGPPELVLDFEAPNINSQIPDDPPTIDWGDIAVTSVNGNIFIYGAFFRSSGGVLENYLFRYDVSNDTFFIVQEGSGLVRTHQLAFDINGTLWAAEILVGGAVGDPRDLYTVDLNTLGLTLQTTYTIRGTGNTSGAYDLGTPVCKDVHASVGNRVWLDENANGVQDNGEPGLAGVTVYLCWATATTCDASNALQSRVTDADGGYVFANIPTAQYQISVDPVTLPAGLAANPTWNEDTGTSNPDHQTVVNLAIDEEYLTADFGYNWNSAAEVNNPPAGATAAIGDRVWNDADGDGTQDANEIGIAGVTVTLLSDPDGDGVFDTPVATTTTDTGGHYLFDNMPAGAYVVSVTPSTLPVALNWTQTGDPDELNAVASAPDHRTSSPVIAAPGDVLLNIDFGYQANPAQTHQIGNTIYFDANGDGSQQAGEYGLAGVTVTLLDGAGNVLATTVTDANGNYVFAGLPDGNYQVRVSDRNNVLAELGISDDPDATLDGQTAITLAGADNNSTNFGYKPAAQTPADGLIGDTVFLDRNGNGLADAGEGLEGVTVNLYDSANNLIGVTHTNENGQYWFSALSAGTYRVAVDTSTLPNAGTGLNNTVDPDGGTANESTVALAAGQIILNQDFGYQVSTPNSISGTLWNDVDADGTLSAGETTGFAGVSVDLLDSDGNVIATTVTDANGNYAFSGLPDGSYRVQVTDVANVLHGQWHSLGASPGSDGNSQPMGYAVTLAGGVNNTTADFGYYSGLGGLGNKVFRDDNANGVYDLATEPGLPGVPVTLTITYPNGDSISLTTISDAAGFYSFDHLLADEDYNGAGAGQPGYAIQVGSVPAGYASTWQGAPDPAGYGNGIDNNADNANGEAGYPLQGLVDASNDFGFAPGGTIGNRVWRDLDGDGVQDANEDGIAGVTVQLTPPAGVDLGNGLGQPIATITDANGEYAFGHLPLGNYSVTVLTPPAASNQTYDEDGIATPNTSAVSLTTGGQEHLSADFGYAPQAGTIGDYLWNDANGDGQQDPGESGLGGVTVYLCAVNTTPCNSGNALQSTVTDASGFYAFTGVNQTDYHVVQIDVASLPAGYTQTGDPDGIGAPDNQTTVPPLNGSGGSNLDADFGYQPPAANHSDIGDRIFTDLNGNGSEDAGEPGIAGVSVSLLVDTTANGVPDTAIASTLTDANGSYLFPSLPNGQAYAVVVTDSANVLGGQTNTADPDGGADSQATIANLSTDRLDMDFGYAPIRPGQAVIGDFLFNDVNGNGLQDAGDQGLEGVTVNLYDSSGNLVDVVNTNENGQYLFAGLDPSASYTVQVVSASLPGGAANWNNTVDPDGGNDATALVNLAVYVNGQALDQDFGFAGVSSNTIGGTIWSDNDGNGLLTDGTGTTPDETGNGLQNVTVQLLDGDGNIVATAVTDASGNYQFDGIPDGTYAVVVTDDNNVLPALQHTLGPNPGQDNNSQDDSGYVVTVAGNSSDFTADFGYMPVVTTPVTLSWFKATRDKQTGVTVIQWATATESGNIGFELYRHDKKGWHNVSGLIPAKGINSSTQVSYRYEYHGPASQEWIIVDVDARGTKRPHGIWQMNQEYGSRQVQRKATAWPQFQAAHQRKQQARRKANANALNRYLDNWRTAADKAGSSQENDHE